MIYTLTVNPSIDYHMVLGKELVPGSINRANEEIVYPGGKGINVSIMLRRLGSESVALGFIAGRTGDMLRQLCQDLDCRSDFVQLPEGETRINVKVDGTKKETAINGQGPQIPADSVGALLEKVSVLTPDDILVVSGSFPKDSLYVCEAIYEAAAASGARLVVDTTGEALRKALAYKPFLIKPNEEELCDLFETMTASHKDIEELMHKAQQIGAQNVLLSRGEKGAVYLSSDGRLFDVKLDRHIDPVSTVGAGDSLLAGFLASIEQNRPLTYLGDETLKKALRQGCAAGTATAGTSWLAESEAVNSVKAFVKVTKAEL